MALLLRALFGAFGAALPAGGLVVEPRTVVVALAVGLVVTVVAAYLPARRAALIPPVAAMRDEVGLPTRSLRVRTGVGIVLAALALLAARAALATTDDVQRSASYAGLSALAALLGTLAGPRSWHAARCWCWGRRSRAPRWAGSRVRTAGATRGGPRPPPERSRSGWP